MGWFLWGEFRLIYASDSSWQRTLFFPQSYYMITI